MATTKLRPPRPGFKSAGQYQRPEISTQVEQDFYDRILKDRKGLPGPYSRFLHDKEDRIEPPSTSRPPILSLQADERASSSPKKSDDEEASITHRAPNIHPLRHVRSQLGVRSKSTRALSSTDDRGSHLKDGYFSRAPFTLPKTTQSVPDEVPEQTAGPPKDFNTTQETSESTPFARSNESSSIPSSQYENSYASPQEVKQQWKPPGAEAWANRIQQSSEPTGQHDTLGSNHPNAYLMDPNTPLERVWTTMRTDALDGMEFRHRLELSNRVLRRIVSTWCLQEDLCGAPEPLQAFQILSAKFSPLASFEVWHAGLSVLLARAIRKSCGTHSEIQFRSVDEILDKISDFWNGSLESFGRCRKRHDGLVQDIRDAPSWEFCIASDEMKQVNQSELKTLRHHLKGFFCKAGRFDNDALLSHSLLQEQYLQKGADGAEASKGNPATFLGFMNRLMSRSTAVDTKRLRRHLRHHYGLSESETTAMSIKLRDLSLTFNAGAMSDDAQAQPEGGGQVVRKSVIDSENTLSTVYKKRIGRAIEAMDFAAVKRLYSESSTAFAKVKPGRIPIPVYAMFLTAYMALRQPLAAVETWNEMLQAGHTPTMATWDAMLKGCGISQDTDHAQDVWHRMVSSGKRPDQQIWATRLQTLFRSGATAEGFRAFEEMAWDWRSAIADANPKRKTDLRRENLAPNGIPKPNTQILNIVIAGLARRRRFADVTAALKLADSFGIELDTYSFNALFKPALTTRDPTTTLKLLERMRTLNISPDMGTYSMIVQSFFRRDPDSHHDVNFSAESHADASLIEAMDSTRPENLKRAPQMSPLDPKDNRQDVIAQLFNGFIATVDSSSSSSINTTAAASTTERSSDVSTNSTASAPRPISQNTILRVFHTFVTGFLIQSEPPSTPQASLVLQHLTARSIQPNAEFYTTIMTYYFRSSPPDVGSIEKLYARALSTKNLILDVVFFDRLIEGYAGHGLTLQAQDVYKAAKKRGRKIGWRALRGLVESLVKVGDRGGAEAIAKEVGAEEREALEKGGEVRYWEGKREFWESVQDCKLSAGYL
ncbi:MAG: hypothetical protein M1828_001595 [Chrysothrix sp. TS-e1954]|nr:MAG: hypothetical protein M1828_001595 [Chrysothrix sp. TS-e1954]